MKNDVVKAKGTKQNHVLLLQIAKGERRKALF